MAESRTESARRIKKICMTKRDIFVDNYRDAKRSRKRPERVRLEPLRRSSNFCALLLMLWEVLGMRHTQMHPSMRLALGFEFWDQH